MVGDAPACHGVIADGRQTRHDAGAESYLAEEVQNAIGNGLHAHFMSDLHTAKNKLAPMTWWQSDVAPAPGVHNMQHGGYACTHLQVPISACLDTQRIAACNAGDTGSERSADPTSALTLMTQEPSAKPQMICSTASSPLLDPIWLANQAAVACTEVIDTRKMLLSSSGGNARRKRDGHKQCVLMRC